VPARVIEGRVVDADTGKAVAGARVEGVTTDRDGRFLLRRVGTRGNLALVVVPPEGEPYLSIFHRVEWPKGVVKQEVEVKLPRGVHDAEITSEMIYAGKPGGSRFYPDATGKLGVPAKGDVKEVSATLRRGVTVRGKLLGPDGKPVARAIVLHRLYVSHDLGWHFPTEARDGVFEVHGLDPDKTVPVYFLDAEKQCGAV